MVAEGTCGWIQVAARAYIQPPPPIYGNPHTLHLATRTPVANEHRTLLCHDERRGFCGQLNRWGAKKRQKRHRTDADRVRIIDVL